MKRLWIVAAFLLTGCVDLRPIQRAEHLLPQVEDLVLMREHTAKGQTGSIVMCGRDEREAELLKAIAHQMECTVDGDDLCVHAFYVKP